MIPLGFAVPTPSTGNRDGARRLLRSEIMVGLEAHWTAGLEPGATLFRGAAAEFLSPGSSGKEHLGCEPPSADERPHNPM